MTVLTVVAGMVLSGMVLSGAVVSVPSGRSMVSSIIAPEGCARGTAERHDGAIPLLHEGGAIEFGTAFLI